MAPKATSSSFGVKEPSSKGTATPAEDEHGLQASQGSKPTEGEQGISDPKSVRRTTSNSSLSMIESYRRPTLSMVAPLGPGLQEPIRKPTDIERKEARDEERSLLEDNDVILMDRPEHSESSQSLLKRFKYLFHSRRQRGQCHDEEAYGKSQGSVPSTVTETAPLLEGASHPHDVDADQQDIDQKWEDAVLEGRIHTSWQREAKVLSKSSAPLVLAFFLEYSLTVASIFTVGHLGTVQLGAVALASMTANITGFAVFNGLATALDTLCPQAWGSKNKKLVGLQTQRMVYFLWSITIPIAITWMCADRILMWIVPDKDVAVLAGRYLKILIIGAPGYALFESTKRYLQAQGLFTAPLYILLICAPLNAFMNWLFVWKFEWGFDGAPVAVATTDILLGLSILCYSSFWVSSDCWPGFTRRALHNWRPMIALAIPGFLQVEAEVAAFELLSLFASYFGTVHLAAQSVLFTFVALTFQTPFSVSIATSNRIASLIGANLPDAAKVSAKVAGFLAFGVGSLNAIFMLSLRNVLPRLFTDDAEVIALVAQTMPVCATFQLFDALACCCNGILRGLGRQMIGGYVQIAAYYGVAIPVSLGTAFGLGWKLYGLWTGVAIALFLVPCVEATFLYRSRWERSVEDAKRRNEHG